MSCACTYQYQLLPEITRILSTGESRLQRHDMNTEYVVAGDASDKGCAGCSAYSLKYTVYVYPYEYRNCMYMSLVPALPTRNRTCTVVRVGRPRYAGRGTRQCGDADDSLLFSSVIIRIVIVCNNGSTDLLIRPTMVPTSTEAWPGRPMHVYPSAFCTVQYLLVLCNSCLSVCDLVTSTPRTHNIVQTLVSRHQCVRGTQCSSRYRT